MSLAFARFPDDAEGVLAELVAKLLEIDDRSILDPAELAEGWADVHHCDELAMNALDGVDGRVYRVIVDTPINATRQTKEGPRRPVVEDRALRLRQAIHRRIVVLEDLTTL